MVQTTTVETDDVPPRREQILDAGERLFAQRGYDGVSMRDIVAETALRNQASLYHHFRNKQALYEDVLKRGLQQILDLMPERHGSTSAEIDENVDRLINYLSAHTHLAQLIQRAALDGSPTLQRLLDGLVRPLYTGGRRALSGLDGLWKEDEVPHLAAALYLMTFGYFANAALLQSVVGKDPLGPKAVERQRRFLKVAISLLFGVPGSGNRTPSTSAS